MEVRELDGTIEECCSKRATRVTENAVIIWVYILQHTPLGFDVESKAVVPNVPRTYPVVW